MPTRLRVALPLFLLFLAVSLIGQAQTPLPGAAQAARPVPPDTAAYQAAVQIREPAAKLAALEKFRTDFPQSASLGPADNQILMVLVANWPERTEAIVDVFDRIVTRIPSTAAPEARLIGSTVRTSDEAGTHRSCHDPTRWIGCQRFQQICCVPPPPVVKVRAPVSVMVSVLHTSVAIAPTAVAVML